MLSIVVPGTFVIISQFMENKLDLKSGQTILFIGDSITDADRNSRAYRPFGFGYVHFVANFLMAKYPTYNLNIINRGISGNTIRDLKNRWQRDVVAELRGEASKRSADPHAKPPCRFFQKEKVMGIVFPAGKSCGDIDHNPDILSVLIGVNDVWRRFASEAELPHAVFADEYEKTYRQLLDDAKQNCSSRLVICEPFMFCDDSNNPMFSQLHHYIQIVHKIAADFDAVLVPFQAAIDDMIDKVPPQKWSDDMVHPHIWAHAWLAQKWLAAAGL